MKGDNTMEKITKITKKDNYNSIIEVLTKLDDNQLKALDFTAEKTEQLIDFCEAQIAQLDKKAAKAKDAAAKKKDETDTLCDAIVAVLTDELTSIPDITEKVEGEDITLGKVQYRLNKLVGLGLAEKGDITIPGGEGVKTRKVVGFKLPSSTDVE